MLKEITPEELIDKSPQEIQLIDIREPYELEDGYILGNINIPMGDILEKTNQLSKTKDIIIYCNRFTISHAISSNGKFNGYFFSC